MRFVFTIEIEVERTEGKFASREDLGQQLLDEFEGCGIDGLALEGENGGQYEVTDVSVTEAPR
jgi:hypothetical protein